MTKAPSCLKQRGSVEATTDLARAFVAAEVVAENDSVIMRSMSSVSVFGDKVEADFFGRKTTAEPFEKVLAGRLADVNDFVVFVCERDEARDGFNAWRRDFLFMREPNRPVACAFGEATSAFPTREARRAMTRHSETDPATHGPGGPGVVERVGLGLLTEVLTRGAAGHP